MAYDYFSQIQGPTVVTSLYGDNYSKGIAAGNAVPSTVTAIVDGVSKGIEQGQQIISNDQAQQINQNRIDRIPIQNQREDLQLQREQQATEMGALELQIAKDTETLQGDTQKAELTEKANRLQQMTALRKKQQDFQTTYQQAANPQLKKQLIQSGQYADVFAANPQILQQSLAPIWGTLSNAEKEAYSVGFAKRQVKDSITAAREKDLPAYTQAQNAWADSPLQKSISVTTGITDPNSLAKKIQIVPSGYYKTDPTNPGKLSVSTTGLPGSQDFMRSGLDLTDVKTYDVIMDGKIIEQNVSGEEKKTWDALRSKMPLHDGTVEQQKTSEAVTKVEKNFKPKTTTPSDDLVNSFNRTPVKSNTNSGAALPADSVAQTITGDEAGAFTPQELEVAKSFYLSGPELEAVKEPIKALTQNAVQVASNPNLTNQAALELEKDLNIDMLSDSIAGIEYDRSPVIKASYNQAKVDAYNLSIDTEMAGLINRPNISNALKIDSPKALYTRERKLAIGLQLNSYYNRILEQQKRTQTTPQRKSESAQKTLQLLNSLRGQ